MASTFIMNRQVLDQLQAASPLEARLVFTTFKLGTAFGYEPTDTETGPRGTIVHVGNVATKDLPLIGSSDLVIALSPDVGPFDFGEIYLYTDTGKLGAVYAFPSLQSKLQASSDGVNSSFIVHCLLKIAQGTATITFAAPSLSTVPRLTSINGGPLSLGTDIVDADGLRLTRASDNTWNIDGHVRIRTAVAVSNVSFNGTQTLFKVTGVDNVVTSIQYRYVVQTAIGQVSRVRTHDSSGTLYIDGSVPWLTNGLNLDLWERLPAQLEAHLLSNDPHPQYLNQSEGDSRYTPVGHQSAADPHSQYLTKTLASTSYTPKSHLTDVDPHNQYQTKTNANNLYLSKAVDSPIKDANNQTRFQFKQGVSGTRATTEIYGAPDSGGETFRLISQDSAGTPIGTLLSGKSNGTVSLPTANLPANDYSHNLAYTSWVIDRLRRPTVIQLGNNGPITKLENFNESHYYSINGNIPFPILNTQMVEDAIYEVLFTCMNSLPNSDIFLAPNATFYPNSFVTSGIRLAENGSLSSYRAPVGDAPSDRFWFDTIAGLIGVNPTGKFLIYNFRQNKQCRYEGQDTVSLITGAGCWLDTPTIWNTVGRIGNHYDYGRLAAANANSYQWRITIRRIV